MQPTLESLSKISRTWFHVESPDRASTDSKIKSAAVFGKAFPGSNLARNEYEAARIRFEL